MLMDEHHSGLCAVDVMASEDGYYDGTIGLARGPHCVSRYTRIKTIQADVQRSNCELIVIP